jgi:polysaccharide biosynthesis/export protein
MRLINLHAIKLVILLSIATTVINAQGPLEQTAAIKEPSPLTSDADTQKRYLLGPGDIVEVRVFGQPDFSGPITVDTAGEMTIPFVEKSIQAKCRTELEVRKDIAAEVAKFVKNPQVSVRVVDYRSRPPAVVFGAVRAPQRVEMRRSARLLELLAGSGGVTEQAGETIQIFHTEPILCSGPNVPTKSESSNSETSENFKLPFEIYKIAELKAGKPEANPEIRPGDIIIVQEAAPISMRNQLSLTRALAMVGGLRKDAKNTVRIYRQKPGSENPEVLIADLSAIKKNKESDIVLKPYDVVDVAEQSAFSPQNLVRTLVGAGTSTINSFAGVIPYRVIQ